MKKGFTLVEMIGVIILIGILSLIAVPTVNVIMKNSKENALQQTIRNIEEAAYNYSNKHDIGYSSKTDIIQISTLKESGNLKDELIINPITNTELQGCVLYRWDDNNKQYQFTYDEECIIRDLEVNVTNMSGSFNEYGWAKEDFYVSIQTNGTSYNYCIASNKCSPNAKVDASNGTAYVSLETDSLYVCAYAIYGNTTSDIVCSDAYKLDKTPPTAGTINITGDKGQNDWYISDIKFTISDGVDELSGHLSTVTDKNEITSNTSNEKVIVTTSDRAGNAATREYDFKVDKGNPSVTITKTVENNKNILTSSTSEATSGYTYEWYKDGQVISDQTSNKLETTSSGTYKLKVTTGSGKVAYSNEIKIDSYTIVYDLNGGTGNISSQTKIQDLSIQLTSTVPTKTGYTFVGWGLTNSDQVATYTKGSIYTNNESVKLYAIWNVNSYTCSAGYYLDSNATSCTICEAGSYCPGGTYNYATSIQGKNVCPSGYGSSAAGSDASSDCYLTTTAGKYIATANSSTQTTCTSGYYCPSSTIYYGSTGGRTSCPSGYGSSATGSDASNDCYKTLTVSFDGNGATSGSMSSQSCSAYYGTGSCNITLASNGYSKTGYSFKYWLNTSTNSSYNSGSTYKFTSDTTLYATWEASYICSTGTLTYDSSKGYICTASNAQLFYTRKYYTRSEQSFTCSDTTNQTSCTSSGSSSELSYVTCSSTGYSDWTSTGSSDVSSCSGYSTSTSNCSGTSCSVCSTTVGNDVTTYTAQKYTRTYSTSGGSWCTLYDYEDLGSYYSDTDVSHDSSVGNSSGNKTTCVYKSDIGKYYCEDWGNVTGCHTFSSSCISSSNFNSSHSLGLDYQSCTGSFYGSWTLQSTQTGLSSCSGVSSTSSCSGTSCTVCSSSTTTGATTYTVTNYTRNQLYTKTSCSRSSIYGSWTLQSTETGLTSCSATDDSTATTWDYDCSSYYACPSGWTTYSGSGSTMQCYKAATTS